MLVPPGDDAGVRLLDENRALVETVDVITPLVNDPFTFGKISAANSLSDIYAMGGRPFSALSIIGYPACDYPPELIREILSGVCYVLDQAGVPLIGGHCFDDGEIKTGLSVTGIVEKGHILRSDTPEEGDLLIITKPLGTGVLTTALKGERATEQDIKEAIDFMCMLNKEASEIAVKAGATACTDVTGFGLIGHLARMLSQKELDLILKKDKLPVFNGVIEFADRGLVPEGAYKNRQFFEELVQYKSPLNESFKLLLFDPQTSGGLLIAIKEGKLKSFEKSGIFYRVIGRFIKGTGRVQII